MTLRRLLLLFSASLACAGVSTNIPGEEVLTLEDAQHLAVRDQPLIDAQQSVIEAQQARAAAAGQLPDPELQLALNELPVNTGDAWSISRDGDTDVMVGVMQEYPRAAKRRLRRLREESGAGKSQQELQDLMRVIRRDVGLGYADVYQAQQALELLEGQLSQAYLEREAAQIRFTAGRGAQAELLASATEAAALQDKVTEQRQMLEHQRVKLSRWIGDAANHQLASALPVLLTPPSLESLLAGLANHPVLLAQERASDLARHSLDLAEAEYKPDWRVELGYGYRPEFSEMLTLRVAVDLPLFTRNRQDQEAAAARHDLRVAAAQREDIQRRLAAEAALAHHDWRLYRQRFEHYEQNVVPLARARVEAAAAAYGGGRGTLEELLMSRRAALDADLQRLLLATAILRSRLALDYFIEGDIP
jgi:outer membrane protein TolC